MTFKRKYILVQYIKITSPSRVGLDFRFKCQGQRVEERKKGRKKEENPVSLLLLQPSPIPGEILGLFEE